MIDAAQGRDSRWACLVACMLLVKCIPVTVDSCVVCMRQQASEISPRLADVAWRILHDGLQAGWAKSKGKNPTAANAPDFKV